MLGGPGSGDSSRGCLCTGGDSREGRAQGQRLSKDRGCKDLREQQIAAPPPVKSFSTQTSTKIPQSPQLQSKPRGARKWEQLWEVGKAGLGGGSLSLGEWLVSFVSDHASTLQRALPPPRAGPVSLQCPQSHSAPAGQQLGQLQLPQSSNLFSMKARLHIFTISAVLCDSSAGDAQLSPQHTVQGWRRRGQSILKASRVLLAGLSRVFVPQSCPCSLRTELPSGTGTQVPAVHAHSLHHPWLAQRLFFGSLNWPPPSTWAPWSLSELCRQSQVSIETGLESSINSPRGLLPPRPRFSPPSQE